jgi:hypothetical protein
VLTRSLFDSRARRSKSSIANGMVRLPGVAPGHARWQGAILLNHNREIERAGLRQPIAVRKDPAHAISIKNKHLLLSPFGDTNPRFHGGCFGV